MINMCADKPNNIKLLAISKLNMWIAERFSTPSRVSIRGVIWGQEGEVQRKLTKYKIIIFVSM